MLPSKVFGKKFHLVFSALNEARLILLSFSASTSRSFHNRHRPAVSCSKTANYPCCKKNKKQDVAPVRVDERLSCLSVVLFCILSNKGLIDAFPLFSSQSSGWQKAEFNNREKDNKQTFFSMVRYTPDLELHSSAHTVTSSGLMTRTLIRKLGLLLWRRTLIPAVITPSTIPKDTSVELKAITIFMTLGGYGDPPLIPTPGLANVTRDVAQSAIKPAITTAVTSLTLIARTILKVPYPAKEPRRIPEVPFPHRSEQLRAAGMGIVINAMIKTNAAISPPNGLYKRSALESLLSLHNP